MCEYVCEYLCDHVRMSMKSLANISRTPLTDILAEENSRLDSGQVLGEGRLCWRLGACEWGSGGKRALNWLRDWGWGGSRGVLGQ